MGRNRKNRMSCWRTSYGATINTVGKFLAGLAVGDATGLLHVKYIHLTPEWATVLFIAGGILKIVGGQWQGMASADHREVKKFMGLNPDGTRGPKESKAQLKFPLPCLFVLVFLLAGCARVVTTQRDTLPDGSERYTQTKITTFMDGKNEVTKLRTTQTDKTQGIGIAGVDQESSGSNVVNIAESVARGAVRGAIEAAKPIP